MAGSNLIISWNEPLKQAPIKEITKESTQKRIEIGEG